MNTINSNPYIGPRPFKKEEANRFFGREREARDLLALVSSQRLVLFYAASGAGKSSLINARLIDALTGRGFEVLPVGRVSGVTPREAGVDFTHVNLFAYFLKQSLAEHRLEAGQADANQPFFQEYVGVSLSDFLLRLAHMGQDAQGNDRYRFVSQEAATEPPPGNAVADAEVELRPRALIIDQFEEIFTTNLQAWEQRGDFFSQLRQAMEDDPYLWVMMAMREDFIANLDPLAHLLPGELHARYYMQRMDYGAALDAIKRPVETKNSEHPEWRRPFAPGVAEKLVNNLRQVHIAAEGGESVAVAAGEFIEPVQLQVVCYQLWEQLRAAPGSEITDVDLDRLAGGQDLSIFVDRALSEFYEQAIRRVLERAAGRTSEAELRAWFSERLITESGTRGFVYRGENEAGGLPNEVVRLLAAEFLIRSESRAGGAWYELSHDRFVEPIQRSNQRWRLEQLQTNPLLRRAHEWAATHAEPAHRDERLLLSDDELKALETTASTHEPLVHEFIEASQRAGQQRSLLAAQRQLAEQKEQAEAEREQAEAERRTSRRLRRVTGLAVVMFVAAVVMAIVAIRAWRLVAEQAEELATTNTQLERTNVNLDETNDDLRRATTRAESSRKEAETANKIAQSVTLADQSLEDADIADRLLLAHAATTAYSATLSARSALLAALDDGYRVNGRMAAYTSHDSLAVEGGPWESLAFDKDGGLLALGDASGGVSLWDNANSRPVGERLMVNDEAFRVYALAFDPGGPRLAAATGDRDNPTAARHDLVLWDLTSLETPTRTVLAANQPAIWSVAWSPDGQRLAVANQDGAVDLWDMTRSAPVSLGPLPGRHTDWAYSVAFDPTGNRLASAGKDGVIILWSNLASPEPAFQTLTDHTAWVNVVAFNPDGAHLASGSDDGTFRLWDLAAEPPSSVVLGDRSNEGVEGWSLSFSPDGRMLATGWGDHRLQVFDLGNPDAAPWELAGHTDGVDAVAFDPVAPQRLVSTDRSGAAPMAWALSQSSEFVHVQPIPSPITPAFQTLSQDGRWLATASADGQVVVSDVETGGSPISVTTGLTVTALALSSDGNRLAVAGCKAPQANKSTFTTCAPGMWLWPLDSLSPATPTLEITSTQPISAIAFHPQSSDQVAVSLSSGEVQIHDFATSVATNLSPQASEIVDLAFSRDGLLLAALERNGLVKIWNWSTRELVDEFSSPEESGEFDAIEFVRDDEWVALAFAASQQDQSGRSKLGLWDRGTWDLVQTFALDAGRAADLVYDQADAALIVIQPQNLARWPMDEAIWRELACTRAGRNLSYDAWRSAFPTVAEEKMESALICKEEYPFYDVSFAETLVREARNAINDCTASQLVNGAALLARAFEMPVQPPFAIAPLTDTLAVLSEQAWENLRQPSRADSEQAAKCLELAAGQLSQARRPTFDAQQAMEAGRLVVEAETQLANPSGDAGPILDALESVLSLGAPWPDNLLRDQALRLLPQAAYRLCQQGDDGGCRRFADVVELMESGDTFAHAYSPGVDETLYFMGKRGQAVTIAMNAVNNAFDTLLRLEGPDPNSIADDTSDDDDGPDNNSLIANYLLPQDGIYRIVPTAYSGAGNYRLSLDINTPRPIAVGSAESSATAQDSMWQFEGRAGQLAAIALNDEDPNFDPLLSLIGPDLAQIKTDTDSGGNLNALIIATLPTSGTYFVGAEPVGSNAPYTLRISEPRPLPYDQPQHSSLISETLWVVEAERARVISMTVTSGRSGAAPRLALFSMDGVPLQKANSVSTSDVEHVPAQIVTQDGGFVVQVSAQNDRVPYTLTLTSVTPPFLEAGKSATATTQKTPLWTFMGASGQIVDISLNTARPALNPNVELLDASGRAIARGDGSGGSRNARIAAMFLPADGQYFVRPVLANSPISYTLVMTTLTPPLITTGEPFTATLGQHTLLAFDGAAGQPIDVLLRSGIGDFASVTLLNDDGQPLGDMTSSRIDDFILPAAGRYYLMVGGELDRATEYALLLTDAVTRPISPGEIITSTTMNDVLWTVEMTKGQVLNISMTTSDSSFTPILTVYAPDGAMLPIPTDSSAYPNLRIKGFIAPTTGRYILRAEPTGSQAEYQLSVEEVQPPRISFGETQTSNTQTTELWRFTGRAGQVIGVNLSGWVRGGFDPYLTLLAGDGSTLMTTDDINSNDDYNARIARFVLPDNGDYFIRAGRPGHTAPYRLRLTGHAPTPITLGSTTPLTQSSAYALSVEQPVFVQVSADGMVDLLLVGPGGDVLIDHTPAFLRQLEATGTYTLGVVLLSVKVGSKPPTLTSAAIPVAPRPLEIGRENRGALSPGATELWSFTADDMAGVRLAVQPTDAFIPVLSLWTSDGELVGSSNQDGFLAAPLPAGNRFLASVAAPDAQASGLYTFTVQPAQVVPGPQACNYSSNAADYAPLRRGSVVLLGRHRPVKGNDGWSPVMDAYVNRPARVVGLAGADSAGCPVVTVDVDQGRSWWRVRDVTTVQ